LEHDQPLATDNGYTCTCNLNMIESVIKTLITIWLSLL